MEIFSVFNNNYTDLLEEAPKIKRKSSKKKEAPVQPAPKRPSDSEIRDKVEAHFTKLRSKNAPQAKATPVAEAEETEFQGDIKDNNPNSAVTQEKLKSLLSSGGFGWNDREREVLSKILK